MALRRRRDPWISVEEVLLGILLVEEVPLVGAEQRVGVLLERVLPCLEPTPRYVHNQLLVLDGFLRFGKGKDWDEELSICDILNGLNEGVPIKYCVYEMRK